MHAAGLTGRLPERGQVRVLAVGEHVGHAASVTRAAGVGDLTLADEGDVVLLGRQVATFAVVLLAVGDTFPGELFGEAARSPVVLWVAAADPGTTSANAAMITMALRACCRLRITLSLVGAGWTAGPRTAGFGADSTIDPNRATR